MAAEEKKQRKKTAKAKSVDSPEIIRIRLVRSVIGSTPHQRAVVAGLGLRRMNQVVERKNTREIRGMVNKVPHLVQIIS
jgi:large subunit ribosomal protein L30